MALFGISADALAAAGRAISATWQRNEELAERDRQAKFKEIQLQQQKDANDTNRFQAETQRILGLENLAQRKFEHESKMGIETARLDYLAGHQDREYQLSLLKLQHGKERDAATRAHEEKMLGKKQDFTAGQADKLMRWDQEKFNSLSAERQRAEVQRRIEWAEQAGLADKAFELKKWQAQQGERTAQEDSQFKRSMARFGILMQMSTKFDKTTQKKAFSAMAASAETDNRVKTLRAQLSTATSPEEKEMLYSQIAERYHDDNLRFASEIDSLIKLGSQEGFTIPMGMEGRKAVEQMKKIGEDRLKNYHMTVRDSLRSLAEGVEKATTGFIAISKDLSQSNMITGLVQITDRNLNPLGLSREKLLQVSGTGYNAVLKLKQLEGKLGQEMLANGQKIIAAGEHMSATEATLGFMQSGQSILKEGSAVATEAKNQLLLAKTVMGLGASVAWRIDGKVVNADAWMNALHIQMAKAAESMVKGKKTPLEIQTAAADMLSNRIQGMVPPEDREWVYAAMSMRTGIRIPVDSTLQPSPRLAASLTAARESKTMRATPQEPTKPNAAVKEVLRKADTTGFSKDEVKNNPAVAHISAANAKHAKLEGAVGGAYLGFMRSVIREADVGPTTAQAARLVGRAAGATWRGLKKIDRAVTEFGKAVPGLAAKAVVKSAALPISAASQVIEAPSNLASIVAELRKKAAKAAEAELRSPGRREF